jgi:hypothetical protein
MRRRLLKSQCRLIVQFEHRATDSRRSLENIKDVFIALFIIGHCRYKKHVKSREVSRVPVPPRRNALWQIRLAFYSESYQAAGCQFRLLTVFRRRAPQLYCNETSRSRCRFKLRCLHRIPQRQLVSSSFQGALVENSYLRRRNEGETVTVKRRYIWQHYILIPCRQRRSVLCRFLQCFARACCMDIFVILLRP